MNTLTNPGPAVINAAHEGYLVLPQKKELNDLAYEQGPLRTARQKDAKQNKHQTGVLTREFADTCSLSLEAHVADWLEYDPFAIQYVFPSPPPVEDGDIGGVFEVKRATSLQAKLVYRTKENHDHIIIQGMVEHNGVDRMQGNIILIGWNAPVFDKQYAKHGGFDTRGRHLSYIKTQRRRPMASLVPLLRGVAA